MCLKNALFFHRSGSKVMLMCAGKKPRILQMHTTVTESISPEIGGTIICTPIGNEPITYEWFDASNRMLPCPPTQNEMHNLKPGDYYVTATDAAGDKGAADCVGHCNTFLGPGSSKTEQTDCS